ncbi:hypothetical protein [Halorientalis marina]|uniref:hypothetical protein n=1 Tax=Halorientalis marina TaxID=2931976 RepID=UPI001FF3FAFE|nr:hypothetical protein [Halorientalis marina]
MAQAVISSPTILAAIVGALVTYFVQLILNKQQQNREKNRLRKGLRTELVQMQGYSETLENVIEDGEFSVEALVILTTLDYPFFEANKDNLALLTEEEQLRLVRFHSIYKHHQKLAEKMLEAALDEGGIQAMNDISEAIQMYEENRTEAKIMIEKHM